MHRSRHSSVFQNDGATYEIQTNSSTSRIDDDDDDGDSRRRPRSELRWPGSGSKFEAIANHPYAGAERAACHRTGFSGRGPGFHESGFDESGFGGPGCRSESAPGRRERESQRPTHSESAFTSNGSALGSAVAESGTNGPRLERRELGRPEF